MKDTILTGKYEGYTLHTELLEGIDVIKDNKVIFSCDTTDEAMNFIDWDIKESKVKRLDISTIEEKEG